MKKTVSINISGVIFHIEEDGYEKLKQYLSSIQQYFSTYEDSQEIVTDIENRVAEKLLAKQKVAGSQVVTLEDVNELIGAMGTVADFEAVDDEDVFAKEPQTAKAESAASGAAGSGYRPNPGQDGPRQSGTQSQYNPGAGSQQTAYAPGGKRLVRDLRRKTIGGVASGIANYFNIDPVWVRLAFVVFVVGLPALNGSSGSHVGQSFFGSLSGFAVLAYIAMWIAFPGSSTLEDDKSVKKFFRNPDDKVLGGVASGLAAYFGVDTGLIRLAFVLGIVFFGVGLLAYLVLWMIAPTANSLTEKMEMQGRPITLTNIEQSIKTNLHLSDGPEENGVTKALLFPFRVIAMLFAGLGRVVGPVVGGLGSVIRVFAGVIILIVAVSFIIACLAVLGAGLGMYTGVHTGRMDVPFELLRYDLNPLMVLAAFLVGLLPSLGLGVLGLTLITRRPLFSSRSVLTGLGIWLVSILILAVMVPEVVNEFRKKGTVEETKLFTIAGMPTLDFADTDSDFRPRLDLKGHAGPQLRLVEQFQSRGRNRAEAEANARSVRYTVVQKDSLLRFNDEFDITGKFRFRNQELNMDLFMPYEKPFRMTERFARFITNRFSTTELDRMEKSLWKFTAADELVCINFPRDLDTDNANTTNDSSDNEASGDADATVNFGDVPDGATRTFALKNFTEIDASGGFIVNVVSGDAFKVTAKGRDDDFNDVKIEVDGNALRAYIDRNGNFDGNNREPIGLTVTMPTVEKLRLTGASQAKLSGFKALKALDVVLTGACKADINATTTDLNLVLTGGSNARLRGRADHFTANLTGACTVDATEITIDRANIDATGASTAEMGTVRSLSSNATGASKITRKSGDME